MELYHNDNFLELLHSEAFWVAVAFFIFVLLSFKKAKKVLIESLDKRIEEIKKRVNEAKELKKEAENNLNEANKNLKNMINDKKRIIKEANEEAKNLENRLFNEEKKYSERFKKRIDDRINQSKKQAIDDIKEIALDISIKSIKDLLNKQKEIKDGQLIGKSFTNLFYKSKKEQKNYNNLWDPSQNGDFLVCLHPHK